MVTIRIIIEKIKEIVCQKYPSCTFYIHKIPLDAPKPAFCIYLDSDRSEDSNRTMTHETTSIGISYFPADETDTSDELNRLNVYDSLKKIFKAGSIRVGDRVLKVVLTKGGRKENEIYLVVKMVYEDERPAEAEVYDLVKEIILK